MSIIWSFSHLPGSSHVSNVSLQIIFKGVFSSWCRVFKKYGHYGCNPSGPHYLFILSWLSSFPILFSWMRMCALYVLYVSSQYLVAGPCDLWEKTLQKLDYSVLSLCLILYALLYHRFIPLLVLVFPNANCLLRLYVVGPYYILQNNTLFFYFWNSLCINLSLSHVLIQGCKCKTKFKQ